METGLIIVLGLLGASTLTAVGIATACFFLYCIRPRIRKRRPLIPISETGRKSTDCISELTSSPRDGLLMSLDSEEEEAISEGEDRMLGRLNFSVAFHRAARELVVTVSAAENLRPPYADLAPLNPLATVLILPDTRHRVSTRSIPRTRNPRWDEVFVFEGFPVSHLTGRELLLTVRTSAVTGPALHTIGEARLPLGLLQRRDGLPLCLTKFLKPALPPLSPNQPSGETSYRGEVELALCYIPGVSRLRLGVVRARNLGHGQDIYPDAFVEAELRHRRVIVAHHRTTVARGENPTWSECFDFQLPPTQLREAGLRVEVFRLVDDSTQKESLGEVKLGADSGPTMGHQWTSMLRSCGKTVTAAHLLMKVESEQVPP